MKSLRDLLASVTGALGVKTATVKSAARNVSQQGAQATNLRTILAARGVAVSRADARLQVKVPLPVAQAIQAAKVPPPANPITGHPVYQFLGPTDPAYGGENPSYPAGYFDAGRVDGFDGTFIGGEWRRIPRAVSRWLIPLAYLQRHAGGTFMVLLGDNARGYAEVWDFSVSPPQVAQKPKSWGGGNAVFDFIYSGSVAVAVPPNPTADMGVAVFLKTYGGSETVGLSS